MHVKQCVVRESDLLPARNSHKGLSILTHTYEQQCTIRRGRRSACNLYWQSESGKAHLNSILSANALGGIARVQDGVCCCVAAPHLNSEVGADAADGVAHVHVLVDGHDVGPAASHALQKPAAAADVQDDLQLWVRLQHGNTLEYSRRSAEEEQQHAYIQMDLLPQLASAAGEGVLSTLHAQQSGGSSIELLIFAHIDQSQLRHVRKRD